MVASAPIPSRHSDNLHCGTWLLQKRIPAGGGGGLAVVEILDDRRNLEIDALGAPAVTGLRGGALSQRSLGKGDKGTDWE
jgi:hypothetical protein